MKNIEFVLLSNGEPYTHEIDGDNIKCNKLAGGLTTGLDPLMKDCRGTWIAWGRGDADFDVVDNENKVKVPAKDGYTLKRINLTKNEINGFYYGFSNKTLWPICHNFISKANFNPGYWQTYYKVNQKYAKSALAEIDDNNFIWVHDYHLTLVPEMIKNEISDARIGFFWHIPWPPLEIFSTIPWDEEIITHMLACEFIGFHTSGHVSNFLDCVEKIGADVNRQKNTIVFNQHLTRVSAIPLGIDYKFFQDTSDRILKDKAKEIKNFYNAEYLIFGVDRLDYTKGIAERIKAMDILFKKYPEYIGKVTLVQRISPSRTEVKEYQKMKDEINRIIGDINGRYSRENWIPIKYFEQYTPQEELLPYYQAADIALITPLIDGLNLVAKEYLAVQDNGVLILSKFAGAAEQLTEAELVNPYHLEQVAEKIHKAIEMDNNRKQNKLNSLKQKVEEYDINWWRDTFLREWLSLYD